MSRFFQLSFSECSILYYALDSKLDDLKACLSSGCIGNLDVKNIIFEQAVKVKCLLLRLEDYGKI